MKIPVYCLFLITAAALIACRSEHRPAPAAVALAPMEVQAFTVEVRESLLQTEVAGTIRSVNRAVVAAKVTGTIEKMDATLGSRVQSGDLLVQISAGEMTARVMQTEARMEQAGRNLARERKLLAKNAATPENVKSLEETFRMAEAAHREAQTILEYTRITAPFDGVVSDKMANVGDLASPGVPLLHIDDPERLQVVVSVPEALVLRIATGETLPVHIPAAGLELRGVVSEVAPAVDPLSRSATVKININRAPQLQPGQFARVFIPGKESQSLSIPSAAVHRFGQMETVFVIEEDKARLRLVRTGAMVNGQLEILAGLEPGETIALHAGSRLSDGQPVRVVQ